MADVLAETGRREQRSRLLPARVVVYLVLALCLFTTDCYEEVVRKLTNGLSRLRIWRAEWKVPVPSAISKARARLGSEPMAELFRRVCVPVASVSTPGAFYAGLRVMAIDGVVLDTPDTPENEAAFHRRNAGTARAGAFPQVRIVSLTECGTHASVWAEFDTWKVGERALTARMTEQFTEGMLILADRGFYYYDLWNSTRARAAHLPSGRCSRAGSSRLSGTRHSQDRSNPWWTPRESAVRRFVSLTWDGCWVEGAAVSPTRGDQRDWGGNAQACHGGNNRGLGRRRDNGSGGAGVRRDHTPRVSNADSVDQGRSVGDAFQHDVGPQGNSKVQDQHDEP